MRPIRYQWHPNTYFTDFDHLRDYSCCTTSCYG
ncbi:unnamed protein product [Spirodela intermedia]|uniref:Uncharacterized protein n=1 Tax=Spirodela intermedia TaxID=51605 RepID=A0A7I8KWG4_SPIIN|nr:unnamed protein product [Spirodela intermedia]